MDKIQKRFDELEEQGNKLPAAESGPHIHKLIEWRTSVASLLSRVFGENSATYQQFQSFPCRDVMIIPTGEKQTKVPILKLLAVFRSAKSEYEGGYLFDIRDLVHAEVFTDELEQAEHFLALKHKIPAAVITGTVLETTLRRLCVTKGISLKTDKGKDKMSNAMIDDLAKVAVFNKMRADQVRAWAKIRNSAAHGKPDEFDEGEVKRMINGVREFFANQLS